MISAGVAEQSTSLAFLLVEDDDGDAKAVRGASETANTTSPIMCVSDDIEAMDVLQGRTWVPWATPFFVLADIHLPRADGHGFWDRLRADATLCHHNVFMLAPSRAQDDIEKADRSVVVGDIVKQDAGHEFLRTANLLANHWALVRKSAGLAK